MSNPAQEKQLTALRGGSVRRITRSGQALHHHQSPAAVAVSNERGALSPSATESLDRLVAHGHDRRAIVPRPLWAYDAYRAPHVPSIGDLLE